MVSTIFLVYCNPFQGNAIKTDILRNMSNLGAPGDEFSNSILAHSWNGAELGAGGTLKDSK